MIVLGIDPGHTGALAFIDTVMHTIHVYDMPVTVQTKVKTRREVSGPLVARMVQKHEPAQSYIEEIWSSAQQQSTNAFTFGDGYGTLKGVLAMGGVPLSRVTPQIWKKTMRCPKDKSEARFRAMELMPSCADAFDMAKDDGRAEAALIALYACLDLGVSFDKPLKLVGLN